MTARTRRMGGATADVAPQRSAAGRLRRCHRGICIDAGSAAFPHREAPARDVRKDAGLEPAQLGPGSMPSSSTIRARPSR